MRLTLTSQTLRAKGNAGNREWLSSWQKLGCRCDFEQDDSASLQDTIKAPRKHRKEDCAPSSLQSLPRDSQQMPNSAVTSQFPDTTQLTTQLRDQPLPSACALTDPGKPGDDHPKGVPWLSRLARHTPGLPPPFWRSLCKHSLQNALGLERLLSPTPWGCHFLSSSLTPPAWPTVPYLMNTGPRT